MKKCLYPFCKSYTLYSRGVCRNHYANMEYLVVKGIRTWEELELGGYLLPVVNKEQMSEIAKRRWQNPDYRARRKANGRIGGPNKNTRGTYFQKERQKWIGIIYVKGERIWLGGHKTEEQAHESYLKARAHYFPMQ